MSSKFWPAVDISLDGDGLEQLAQRFNLMLYVQPQQPPLDSPDDLPAIPSPLAGEGQGEGGDWPPSNTAATASMPYFCDGNYGDELYRVSPEGNVYGHVRRFRRWEHDYWWDGTQWIGIGIAGAALTYSELPTGPRPFGEIWNVRFYDATANQYYWRLYYWDSSVEEFKPLHRYWNVDNKSDLPNPGRSMGELHAVVETNVLLFWNGYQWLREKHSRLEDDEPERHLPPGFLQMVSPDARVVWISPTEISLEAIPGGSGLIWVNGEFVKAERSAAVTNKQPTLEIGSAGILPVILQPETEYWIYVANSRDAAFSVHFPLPPGEGQGEGGSWDFRGRLFLSTTPETDGYLSTIGPGRNARLVGKVETDDTPTEQGGPFFLREVDISLISRTTNFPETLRDFSDYQVQFVDGDTLRFALLDGAYGQIYVAGNLHYLGVEYDITTNDPWVSWNDEAPGKIQRETGALSPNMQHYIYISGDVDEFNFNAVNPATNRPWTSKDIAAEGNYDASLDMRLKPFLSPKAPDHGRLDEQWPGYVTRHIGQIMTDSAGMFRPSADVTAIRQPVISPSYYSGLADIRFVNVDDFSFKVAKRTGTDGLVNVAGLTVQTYDQDDARVHVCATTDIVQEYDENSPDAPLQPLNAIEDYPDQDLYLYLANNRSFWGDFAGALFCCLTAPVNGYLSGNWPGNNARWLARIRPTAQSHFSGNFIKEIAPLSQLKIDDSATTFNDTWSSAKIQTSLSANMLYEQQKTAGILVRLERVNSNTIKLVPLTDPCTIVFPDLSMRLIPQEGITLQVSGSVGTFYYVYIGYDTFFLSTQAPDTNYSKLNLLSPDKVLVGSLCFTSLNSMAYDHNVCSRYNEPTRTWTAQVTADYTELVIPGLIYGRGTSLVFTSVGGSVYRLHGELIYNGNIVGTCLSDIGAPGYCIAYYYVGQNQQTLSAWRDLAVAPASLSQGNIYGTFSYQFTPHCTATGNPAVTTCNAYMQYINASIYVQRVASG